MKLDEIFDRDEHKSRIAAAMQQIQRQYAPSPRDPAKEAARAESRKRAEAEWAHRDNVLMPIVADIAKKYKGNQFDQFKAEVERNLKPEELKILGDLQTAWKIANPEQAEISRKSWEDYGRKRAAHDPSVTGIGPGGARNWTGD